MDPLSDVLSLLKPRSYVSSGFDAGGEWSIQFSTQHELIKCYAVISGECWLSVEGVSDPVRLETGDCFVLPSGRPFRLASDMDLTPVEARTVFPPARAGGVVTHNGGGDFFLVGSRFGVSGNHAGILLRMLPPIVHIRRESDQAALRWSVERMMQELREQLPGGSLVAQHLAHMMLVQALRLHLAEGPGTGVGWFFALADKQIAAAIHAIHDDPAHRWTLHELCERAGMSRSTFAQKFKATAGETPMEYLARWRMLLAGDRLENSSDPTSVIALSLATNPKAPSAQPSKGLWAVPHGNTAVARARRRPPIPTGRPPSPPHNRRQTVRLFSTTRATASRHHLHDQTLVAPWERAGERAVVVRLAVRIPLVKVDPKYSRRRRPFVCRERDFIDNLRPCGRTNKDTTCQRNNFVRD